MVIKELKLSIPWHTGASNLNILRTYNMVIKVLKLSTPWHTGASKFPPPFFLKQYL
jgi:hypothetical protein